jgi:hypothetical protein
MVEPLSARAFLALSIARKLSVEEQELVAGILRGEARESRRLTQIREDMDIVARAARTPYRTETAVLDGIPFTPVQPAHTWLLLTPAERRVLVQCVTVAATATDVLGLGMLAEDMALVRELHVRLGEADL